MTLLMLSSLLILSSTHEPYHMITLMISFLKENQKPHNDKVPPLSMIFMSCSVVAYWIFFKLVLRLRTKFKQ